jgi:hypothetical protein
MSTFKLAHYRSCFGQKREIANMKARGAPKQTRHGAHWNPQFALDF